MASLAHMGRKEEFRRAFAVATCHDFFNYMAVLLLFPLELMTGYLDGGLANPLSVLSVRSLEDLGLSVDASSADPYVLPAWPQLRAQSGYDLAAAEVVMAPRGTLEPATYPGGPARLRPLPGARP